MDKLNNEIAYSKRIIRHLRKKNSPEFWSLLGMNHREQNRFNVINEKKDKENALKIAQLNDVKCKTADIMICTTTKNIIIENKLFGAELTPRQKRYYINIFLDLYFERRKKSMKTKKNILYFLLDKKRSIKKYKALLDENRDLDLHPLNTHEKKKLSDVSIKSIKKKGPDLVVKMSGKYAGHNKRTISITVKTVEVGIADLDKILF